MHLKDIKDLVLSAGVRKGQRLGIVEIETFIHSVPTVFRHQ